MSCLSEETIAAWAMGSIDDDERGAALAHVEACAQCRAIVAAVVDDGPSTTTARLGRYELRGNLGAGGMGVVLRAHDPLLGRDVAIKMVHATLDSERGKARMLREARALATLSHRNVVGVHDCGEAGDEIYIVMELIDGVPLPRWLDDAKPGRAARFAFLRTLGSGLAAVHAAGLVHRDLKPDNVLVRTDGSAVLVDFGLAYVGAVGPSRAAGTPAFVAPEVARGEPATAPSDQYQYWSIVSLLLGDEPRLAAAIERGRAEEPDARHRDLNACVAALERAERPSWSRRPSFPALLASAALGVAWLARPHAASPADAVRADWQRRRPTVTRALHDGGASVDRVLAALDGRAEDTAHDLERTAAAPHDAASLRREACLRDTWDETTRNLDELAADPVSAHRIVDDLIAVLPVDRCRHGVTLRGRDGVSEPVRRATQRLMASRGDVSGDPRAALDALDRFESEVRDLDDPDLRAGILVERSRRLMAIGRARDAATALDDAALLAQRAGDDDTYARALVNRILIGANLGEKPTEEHLAQARAAVDRLGNPAITARLANGEARLLIGAERSDRALPILVHALDSIAPISIDAHAVTSDLLNTLAAVDQLLGRPDLARRVYERGIAVATRRYGPDNAHTLAMRGGAAANLIYLHDLHGGEQELRAVAAAFERTQRGPTMNQFQSYGHLCEVVTELDPARAASDCAHALALGESVFGRDDPQLAWPLTQEGQRLVELGRPAQAIAPLERALRLTERGPIAARDVPATRAWLAIALARSGQQARGLTIARAIAAELGTLPSFEDTRAAFRATFPSLTTRWPSSQP